MKIMDAILKCDIFLDLWENIVEIMKIVMTNSHYHILASKKEREGKAEKCLARKKLLIPLSEKWLRGKPDDEGIWKISWDYFNERKIVIIKSILIWGSSNFTCAAARLARTPNTPKIDNYINGFFSSCSANKIMTFRRKFSIDIR